MAAREAARALPELVARCARAPADDRGGQGERCVVQALIAVQPHPARYAVQVAERRSLARGRPMLPPRLPIRRIAQREVTGLAAHDGESHGRAGA